MLDAFEGSTVAVSVEVAPTVRASVLLDMLMPVTGTRTVTVQVAFCPPEAVAVIIAVPGPTAVTLPPETVATEALEVVHVTVLLVALDGLTVAVSVEELPALRVREVWLRVMPVVGILTLIKTAPGFPSRLYVESPPPLPIVSLYDEPPRSLPSVAPGPPAAPGISL